MGVFRVISGSDTNTIEAQRERLRFALMGAEYPSPEAMAKDAAAYQASEREREAALRESRIPPAITDEARERLAVACGLPPTASESGRERLRAALQGSRYVPPQYRPAPMEERTSQNLHESIRRKANEVRR